MRFDVLAVVIFGVGAILIYSAIKDKDPRDVVKEALGQKPAAAKTPTVGVPNAAGQPTTPGDRTKN